MTWQVKDFADGWIDVADEAAAVALSKAQSGAAIRWQVRVPQSPTHGWRAADRILADYRDKKSEGMITEAEQSQCDAESPPTSDTFRSWITRKIDEVSSDIGAAHQEGGIATEIEKARLTCLLQVLKQHDAQTSDGAPVAIDESTPSWLVATAVVRVNPRYILANETADDWLDWTLKDRFREGVVTAWAVGDDARAAILAATGEQS